MKSRVCLAIMVSIFQLASSAHGEIRWTDLGGGDHLWRTDGNWDYGVPIVSDIAQVDGNSVCIIDASTTAVCATLWGPGFYSGPTYLNVTGGSLTVSGEAYMGYSGAGTSGTLNISGGNVTIGSTMWLGYYQIATLNTTGGVLAINGASGLISGKSIADVNGGVINVNGQLVLGYTGGPAVLNMRKGTINTANIWTYANSVTINMTGGTINCTSLGLPLSGSSAAIAHLQLDGGTINADSFSLRSWGGTGTVDVRGGKLVINGDVTSTINSYAGSTWITAYGGNPRATLNVIYYSVGN
jgi:hypothetical protein